MVGLVEAVDVDVNPSSVSRQKNQNTDLQPDFDFSATGRDKPNERSPCQSDPRGEWQDPHWHRCPKGWAAGSLAGDEPWVSPRKGATMGDFLWPPPRHDIASDLWHSTARGGMGSSGCALGLCL